MRTNRLVVVVLWTIVALLSFVIWGNSQTGPQGVVVDDSLATTTGGTPPRVTTCGLQGGMRWVPVNGNTLKFSMTWNAQLQAGRYAVMVFIPGCNATTQNARYRITHKGGETVVVMNQATQSNVWWVLGVYEFGAQARLVLGDDTGELTNTGRRVGFDAAAWVPLVDRFAAPLATLRITQAFGDGHCVNTPGRYGHLGEDLRANLGTSVLATAHGIVTWTVGWVGAWGNVVEILHVLPDGMRRFSVYAHLSVFSVKPGDLVQRGQKIGESGNTGSSSTAAHLHFEIKDRVGLGRGYAGSNFAGDNYRDTDGRTYYMPSIVAGYRINPPSAPSGLAAVPRSSTSVSLTWTHDGRNVQSFQVERSTDGATWAYIATCALGGSARSHVDAGVGAGRTYYYRVRAYDAASATGNASGYSNVVKVTTPK